jgi:hypothetical protein
MPNKTENKQLNSQKMSSQQLTQKAAGYMLAAANASKKEQNTQTKNIKK